MNRLLLSVVAVLAVAACSAGPNVMGEAPSIEPDALRISANNLAFSTSTLSAPAQEAFQIVFDNQESAPHNVAIYRDASAAERMFGSEPFGGPAVAVYGVPALEPGTFFFRCDVHPDMSGQLVAG